MTYSNIYEEVNAQLENREIDSAEIAAIGFTPSIGRYAQMDDGSRVRLSDRDYWWLDDNLEAMNACWRAQQAVTE